MTEPDNNEIDPFVRLGRRLRDEARGVGLKMDRFIVTPNLDGEAHTVSGVFFLDDDDDAMTIVDDSTPDPAFDELVAEQDRIDTNDRTEQARERLRKMGDDLRNPKRGLGLDDDE